MNREIEDGFGCAGFVPTKAESSEHEEYERMEKMYAEQLKNLNALCADRDRLRLAVHEALAMAENLRKATGDAIPAAICHTLRTAITKAHGVGRICGEPLWDNGKPVGVCAQPFGTEHSHQD